MMLQNVLQHVFTSVLFMIIITYPQGEGAALDAVVHSVLERGDTKKSLAIANEGSAAPVHGGGALGRGAPNIFSATNNL